MLLLYFTPPPFLLLQNLKGDVCVLSCVQLFVAPWTVSLQAFLSMEYSRQEY